MFTAAVVGIALYLFILETTNGGGPFGFGY